MTTKGQISSQQLYLQLNLFQSFLFHTITTFSFHFHSCQADKYYRQGLRDQREVVTVQQRLFLVGQFVNCNIKSITMEGRYYTFYQSAFQGHVSLNQTFDIDELLNSYSRPPETQEKQTKNTACFETYFTSFPPLQPGREKVDEKIGEPPPHQMWVTEQDWNQQYNKNAQFKVEEYQEYGEIEVGSWKEKNKIEETQSSQPQTLNLSTYFHQQISHYLNHLHQCRILSPQQEQMVQKYLKEPRTFSTNSKLFRNSKIRNKCLEYVKSSYFVGKILKSTRMKFSRKINIIKYISRMCECIKEGGQQPECSNNRYYEGIKKWKKQ